MSDRPTILILDDEPLIRLMLQNGLENAGYYTATAGSCAEALRIVRSSGPSAALFDLRLPDGCGLDLIREIRSEGRMLPVIVMSAEAQFVPESAVDELQLAAVCSKPPSIPDVIVELERAMDGSGEAAEPERVADYQVWHAATDDADLLEALSPSGRVVIDCRGLTANAADPRVEMFIRSAGDRAALCGADETLRARWAALNELLLCVDDFDELAAHARRFTSSAERSALLDSLFGAQEGGRA